MLCTALLAGADYDPSPSIRASSHGVDGQLGTIGYVWLVRVESCFDDFHSLHAPVSPRYGPAAHTGVFWSHRTLNDP